jgi:hypothetical protein
VKKSFNIQELLFASQSPNKSHGTKAHAPLSLLRGLSKDIKKRNLKQASGGFDGSHNYKTKQTNFIDRFAGNDSKRDSPSTMSLSISGCSFKMHVTNMSRTFQIWFFLYLKACHQHVKNFSNLVFFVFESMSPTCQELFKFEPNRHVHPCVSRFRV